MKNPMRDDFTAAIKDTLAKRVGYRCSNPDCNASTSGPCIDSDKTANIGVASHITAASPGGPRYDASLTPKDRSDFDNGIWLCQNCAKLVDNDSKKYTVGILHQWKAKAEKASSNGLGKPIKSSLTQVQDKWVSYDYVQKAGIASELEKAGYNAVFARADEECKRIELDGWEIVEYEQSDGTLARMKIRDNSVPGGYLILLRKQKS